MRGKRRLTEWPDDLRLVLIRLAMECADKAVTSDRLLAAVGPLSGTISDHEVILSHEPKGSVLKRRALFAITIEGERTKGRWTFTPGELASLVAETKGCQ